MDDGTGNIDVLPCSAGIFESQVQRVSKNCSWTPPFLFNIADKGPEACLGAPRMCCQAILTFSHRISSSPCSQATYSTVSSFILLPCAGQPQLGGKPTVVRVWGKVTLSRMGCTLVHRTSILGVYIKHCAVFHGACSCFSILLVF